MTDTPIIDEVIEYLKKRGVEVGVSAFDTSSSKPTPKLRDKNCYRVRINCLGQRLKKKV